MNKYLTPIKKFFLALKLRRLRSHAEFAEEEIILPDGPHEGERLDLDLAPWTRLLLAEYENPRWRRFFIAGPVQSGKTLLGFMEPLMYWLFELEENLIIGVPVIELAQGIWDNRILPIIRKSKYAQHLPKTGPGSKGGKVRDYVRLGNGVILRFMAAGGGDVQRSSYPARGVFLTELDKMDKPGEASRETDPTAQIEARTTAYGERARIFGECTVSVAEGKIWREVMEIGTGTKIYIRCPYCKKYLFPERQQFKGWDRETVGEAMRSAYYECQECGEQWDEADRREALAQPKFVHKSPEAAENTDTFGLHYNQFHSPLISMAEIARKHWTAHTSGRVEDEKELSQFVWAVPYEDEYEDEVLTKAFILTRAGGYQRGQIPEEADFTICAIDVQKFWLYWGVEAYRLDEPAGLTTWTVDWGAPDIVPQELRQGSEVTTQMIQEALDKIYEEHEKYNCQALWIDLGYRHEDNTRNAVKDWAAQKADVYPLVGRGHGQMEKLSGKELKRPSYRSGDATVVHARRQSDRSVLWFGDADYLKLAVHASFRIKPGMPGANHLPAEAAEKENQWLATHLCAEQYLRRWEPGKGMVMKWVEMKRRHDYLDVKAYARAGAIYHAYQLRRGGRTGGAAPAESGGASWTERKVRRGRPRGQ